MGVDGPVHSCWALLYVSLGGFIALPYSYPKYWKGLKCAALTWPGATPYCPGTTSGADVVTGVDVWLKKNRKNNQVELSGI